MPAPGSVEVSLSKVRVRIDGLLNRLGMIKTMLESLNFLRKLIIFVSFIDLTLNLIQHLTVLQLNFLNLLLQTLKLFLQILYFIRIYWRYATMWFWGWAFVRLVDEYIAEWWFERGFMDWHFYICHFKYINKLGIGLILNIISKFLVL